MCVCEHVCVPVAGLQIPASQLTRSHPPALHEFQDNKPSHRVARLAFSGLLFPGWRLEAEVRSLLWFSTLDSSLMDRKVKCRTCFGPGAEPCGLLEGGGGEGQASTLPQAVLQHRFKLGTQTDHPAEARKSYREARRRSMWTVQVRRFEGVCPWNYGCTLNSARGTPACSSKQNKALIIDVQKTVATTSKWGLSSTGHEISIEYFLFESGWNGISQPFPRFPILKVINIIKQHFLIYDGKYFKGLRHV